MTHQLIVVTQINPRVIWSWDKIQNDDIVVPFPMSPRSPYFDVVWRSYDRNINDVSAEFEGDVTAELEMSCNLEKTIV
jgi:hypothetical protein